MIEVTAIIPDNMNIKALKKILVQGLKEEGEALEKDYSKTSSTWNNDTPTYPPQLKSTSTELSVSVAPTGSQLAVNKWMWLNFGTSVRYATMSGNWKSKTAPGRLQSGPGRGRVVRVSRMNPRPGIKARKWNTMIFKKSLPRFNSMMSAVIERGANALY